MILLWLVGCVYRVNLTSLPMPARVTLPDGSVAVTPVEAQLRWAPFRKQPITVTAPGYRSLSVDLRRSEVRFGRLVARSLFRPAIWAGGPHGDLRLVLVPDHGPAGTWSPGDENLR